MAAQVLEQLTREEHVVDKIPDVVQEAIEEKSKKLPKKIISAEGLMHFLVAIIFLMITLQSSKEEEERIIRTIERIEEPLINFIEKHEDMDSQRTFYFVTNSVNLRTLPTTEASSSIITVLHPNQRVELITRKDEWLYVRYFDPLEGVPRTGWVYYRYLSLVQ